MLAVAALVLLTNPASAQGDGAARELLAEIEAYDTQILALDAQLGTLETTLAAAEAARTAKLEEAKSAAGKVSQRASGARALLRSLYRIRRFGMLRLLFGADDPVELRRRASYLTAVLASDEDQTAEFARLAAEKTATAKAAEEANAATRALRDQLTTQRTGLDAERKRRVSLLREIRGQPSLVGRVITETATAREALDSSVRAREGSMPASQAVTSNVDFRSLRGRLPKPVSGQVLHGFGPVVDATTGARTNNPGIDWQAQPGSSFRAVAAGEVTRAGYVRGYGQMVMVQHGNFSTLYAHANGLRVFVGQSVAAGDALGTVGTTGLAEDGEPQLHFEIRYNGTPQDPTEWLAR
ncbi:peptidase M23 [Deltaproteobacteria bacterium]|nr:peptidase M23 [Deltaproteobacteria bacterium]